MHKLISRIAATAATAALLATGALALAAPSQAAAVGRTCTTTVTAMDATTGKVIPNIEVRVNALSTPIAARQAVEWAAKDADPAYVMALAAYSKDGDYAKFNAVQTAATARAKATAVAQVPAVKVVANAVTDANGKAKLTAGSWVSGLYSDCASTSKVVTVKARGYVIPKNATITWGTGVTGTGVATIVLTPVQ